VTDTVLRWLAAGKIMCAWWKVNNLNQAITRAKGKGIWDRGQCGQGRTDLKATKLALFRWRS